MRLLCVVVGVVAAAVSVVAMMNLPPTSSINLSQGSITGYLRKPGNGKGFYIFKGIPFAEPPVGQLRLRDPVGAGGWTGVRNGSWEPPQCPQLHGNMLLGEEDCLYLNIFTQLRMSRKQPVLVYIHGGGFVSGRAAASPPLALMNRDVVLVVIQYRLGVLAMYKRDSLQQALQREPYMVSSVILSLDEPMISEHLVNLSLLVHLKDVLSNEDALAQTLNDGLVGVCLEDTALLHSEAHPTAKVFLYQLGYSEQPSLHYTREHFIDDHCAAGVCHLDTLHYIFEGTLGFPFLSNPQDHALANIMVDLWTNFITSGNPTPDYTLGWKWEALAPASFRHLLLSLTPAMSDDTRLQVRHFWHTLPTQHNIILFPNVVDHIRDPQAAKATRERMIHDDMADIHKINASNILAISEESNMANAETAQVSGKSFAEVLQNTGSLTCIIVEDMIIKNTEFFMKVNYSSCFVNKFYVSIEGYEGPSDKYNFLTCDIVRELSNTDCFKKASSNTSCYIFEFYTAKDCDVNDDVKIGEVEEEHCCEGSEVALIGVEEMLVCREKDKTTESGSVKPNAPHSLSKTRLDDTCREYRKRQRGEGSWKKHYEKKLDCDEFSNILEAYIKLKFEKSSYEHLLVSVDEVDYVYAPLKSRLKSPTNW
ncbi:uncharacterized protein [Cherax quadricarinatus]|uniref:uncharacterized protein isoform X6 n=1 Tax=Cherax quadricarinatus TaxID=27406 RepID=UPI00387EE67A